MFVCASELFVLVFVRVCVQLCVVCAFVCVCVCVCVCVYMSASAYVYMEGVDEGLNSA